MTEAAVRPGSIGANARHGGLLLHPGGARASHRLAPPAGGPWIVLDADFGAEGLVDARVEFVFRSGGRALFRPSVAARNRFRLTVRARETIEAVVLHAEGSGRVDPVALSLEGRSTAGQVLSLGRVALARLRQDPARFVRSALWFLERMAAGRPVALPGGRSDEGSDPYERWIALFDDRPREDAALYAMQCAALHRRRRISVLAVPEPGQSVAALAPMMQAQIYPEWELVAAAEREAADDSRIRFVPPGAERVSGLNAAMAAASGEIVLPLPAGAVLRPHALLMAALAFDADPGLALLSADEDELDREGRRREPLFKAGWSPLVPPEADPFGDPVFLDAALVRGCGGWRPDEGAAAERSLRHRIAQAAGPARVSHCAKVLLHRTSPPTAADPASMEAPRLPNPAPLVSLIVPTRDRSEILGICIRSILERTLYSSFEIIIVDNGSQEPATFALFEALSADPRIRILRQPGPFNYAALNNAAAREARGWLLALVNNDIEVVAEDWLGEMVGYALRPEVGCVGAKLLYPDGTVQHAGIVTGLLGGAGHGHKHAPGTDRGYGDALVTTRAVSAVTAACLVLRKDLYEAVGGFDEERFAVAFNDVDLCLKVEAAGCTNLWTPRALLIHHESVSRGADLRDRSKAKRFAAELAALEERWGERLLDDPFVSPHLSGRHEIPQPRTD
ncbi:MAG TPA: glycosyltransferase [Microvirga sp.]|jgi:GT2 family glycosyltransferase